MFLLLKGEAMSLTNCTHPPWCYSLGASLLDWNGEAVAPTLPRLTLLGSCWTRDAIHNPSLVGLICIQGPNP